jgi:hypothetical protein
MSRWPSFRTSSTHVRENASTMPHRMTSSPHHPRLRWPLESADGIGSSIMAWDTGNQGGAVTIAGDFVTARATYTGLPIHNSDFGLKRARIKYGGKLIAEDDFEVFFEKNNTNHPGAGSGTTPNWFYYWREGNVCLIPPDAIYQPSTTTYGYTNPTVDRYVRIGNLASTNSQGPFIFDSHDPLYGNVVGGETNHGIQCCAQIVYHELYHLTIHDDLNAGEVIDLDIDSVHDDSEASLAQIKSNILKKDTFDVSGTISPVYSTYGDNEVRFRKLEKSQSALIRSKCFPEKDWAKPGCQSFFQFGPFP